MNVGRVLEIILIAVITASFAALSHVVVKMYGTPYTQTVNRVVAYYILVEGRYNESKFLDYILDWAGEDVVYVEELYNFDRTPEGVLYKSEWGGGYYAIRAYMPPGVVIEVRIRG